MRWTRVIVAIAALICGISAGSAHAASAPAKPPLLRLQWHTVARGVTTVLANDRYLVYGTANGVTLIDQRTHRRSQIAESDCPAGQFALGLFLGGPWLAGCPDPQAQRPYTRLYNIPGHYWRTVPGPACWPCYATAVGSRWIELAAIPARCQSHCAAATLLQNIGTGESKADPVTPGGTAREDLSSATGTSSLCRPLRYPAIYDGSVQAFVPGGLTMLGRFALTSSTGASSLLERCHSSWHRRLKGVAFGNSQIVLWSDYAWISARYPNHALFLGSLRQFDFFIPQRFHPGRTVLQGIALSGRTLYVLTAGRTLWAAKVPRIG